MTFNDLEKQGAFSPDGSGLFLLTDTVIRDLPSPALKRARAYGQLFPGIAAMDINGRIDQELERRSGKAAKAMLALNLVTLVAAIVAAIAAVLALKR